MELSFKACPISEWRQAAQKIPGIQEDVLPHQNIFASLQYFGMESVKKSARTAYCVSVDGTSRAWALVYHISDSVIRARALYVEEGFRGLGLMTFLLQQIENLYSSRAKKMILFVKDDTLSFYDKLGFKVVESFHPRPIEFYSHKENKYVSPPRSIVLMEKEL